MWIFGSASSVCIAQMNEQQLIADAAAHNAVPG